jgi:putative flippase GtrA
VTQANHDSKISKNNLITQMYRFYIVGLLNTTIVYLFFSFLVFIGISYSLALVADYIFGGFLSYFLNKKYTFNNRSRHTRQIVIKMVAVLILVLVVNVIILVYLVEYKQYNIYISQFLSIIVASLFSFYLQKMQVFRDS